MVTIRIVKASSLSRMGVLVGKKGPGVELRQCVTKTVFDHPENC